MSGAMGWRPKDFWSATFAEFFYCFRGWQRSQGIDPEKDAGITKTELDDLNRQFAEKDSYDRNT